MVLTLFPSKYVHEANEMAKTKSSFFLYPVSFPSFHIGRSEWHTSWFSPGWRVSSIVIIIQ
jgi:hypothetical protein